MSKVKRIRPNADSAGTLPPELESAIFEQQSRVWELHNLLVCLDAAIESNDHDIDEPATVGALIRLAATIHMDLDAGALVKRAQEIAVADVPARQEARP
jgi:hypothetical protein